MNWKETSSQSWVNEHGMTITLISESSYLLEYIHYLSYPELGGLKVSVKSDNMEKLKVYAENIVKQIYSIDAEVINALEKYIECNHTDQETPYLYVFNQIYTLKEILKEVKLGTVFGKGMVQKLIYLTIDLLVRKKEKLN